MSQPIDRPRSAALELLRAVREDDAYANLVLPQILHGYGLSGRDAGFATELGYGTLRWKGWYDAILASCVTRPWSKVEPGLQDILRLGAHQVLAMRVPDHAAVDSSCDLARELGTRSGADARAGFVNAVLRKVAARDESGWASTLQGDRPDGDVDWLATRWSHPVWMVRAFRDSLDTRRDELVDLLRADNVPARPVVVARPGRMTPAELLDLPEVEPGRWSPLAATVIEGAPDALACVRDGRAGVQDEGSQLVALALRRRSRALTPRGSTRAPAPAARPPYSRASPQNVAPVWSPSNRIPIALTSSVAHWRPSRHRSSSPATRANGHGATSSSTAC